MRRLKEEKHVLKERLEQQADEYYDDDFDDEYYDDFDDFYEDVDEDVDDDDDFLFKYDFTDKSKVKKSNVEAHKRLQDVLFEREVAQIDREFFDI